MDKIVIVDNKRYKIEKSKLSIGRSSDCDITLQDDKISRIHGFILNQKSGLFFQDNGSSNGSYLNNKLVSGKKKIEEGDIIQIGTYVLKIDLEVPTRRYPALEEIEFENAVECPDCGKKVSDEARYCVFCGHALKQLVRQNLVPCPSCGEFIEPGAEKCESCNVVFSEETYQLDLSEVTPVYVTKTEAREKEKPMEDIETEYLGDEIDTRDIQSKIIYPEKPAGAIPRIIAAIIDLCFFILISVIFVIGPSAGYFYIKKEKMPLINFAEFVGFMKDVFVLPAVVLALIALLYVLSGWTRSGSTPGKKLMGLYVFNAGTNTTPLKPGKALVRFFAYIPGLVLIFAGLWMIPLTKKKQGLHDIIAGTVVAHKK